MLSLSLQDSPFPSEQPLQLSITRVEVFVIPALAIDSTGYRVCLRISSDLGLGWNEQFVSDSEPSLQLDRWGPLFRSFIGRFSIASLTEQLTERIAHTLNPDNRAYRLFSAAITQLQNPGSGRPASSTEPAEESILQQRAVAYLSVD
ncbi:hypothetical protein [Paenibacillus paeoniae]|uniref:Uncharacterized protein n=1 Tax=Paenibacillus paeoniae TaxID=2292705 RepID=A0A371PHX6_9BACL|nr:hypothetical protein [Paenibacillus paeoniae]REK75743.1 hypothetical protein DX130_01290 [Paenibacillus paeoniae]